MHAVFSWARIVSVSAAPAIRLAKKSMSSETGSRFSSKATARALTKSDRSTKFLSPCRLDVGERRGDNFARHSAPRSMVLQVRSTHTSVTDLPPDASVARRIPDRHHRYWAEIAEIRMPMGRDNGSPRRDDSASRAMRSRRQTTGEKPGNEIIPDMKQPPLTARRMTNASPCTRAIGGVFSMADRSNDGSRRGAQWWAVTRTYDAADLAARFRCCRAWWEPGCLGLTSSDQTQRFGIAPFPRCARRKLTVVAAEIATIRMLPVWGSCPASSPARRRQGPHLAVIAFPPRKCKNPRLFGRGFLA